MDTKLDNTRASESSSACELKIGFVPSVFVAGREQEIVVYSRCKGAAKWEVADTDEWDDDVSNRPNRDGYYSYRLRATWRNAVVNKQGIRFSLQPQDEQQQAPQPLVFDIIVERTEYAQVEIDGPVTSSIIAKRVAFFVAMVASFGLGLWAIADTVTIIVPAIVAAWPGNTSAIESQHSMEIVYNLTLIFLSIVLLAVLVVEGEHAFRHDPKPGSAKLFAIVLGVEAAILVIAQVV